MVNTYRCVIIRQVKKITSESVVVLKRAGMENINRKNPFHGILKVVLVLSIVLASCQSEPVPISEPVEQETLDIVPDELSESTATLENLSVSLADEDQAVEEINQCLVCHTNKQALVDTVSPLVVVMSESSGEG